MRKIFQFPLRIFSLYSFDCEAKIEKKLRTHLYFGTILKKPKYWTWISISIMSIAPVIVTRLQENRNMNIGWYKAEHSLTHLFLIEFKLNMKDLME